MIEELRVRGVGGIRSAELVFSGSFIVITGESGAGKSSLVRAFEFISGRRAQTASIHSACDDASAEAVWSEDWNGERLITGRYISRGGKGRCLVHGELATLGQLTEAVSPLIEIQSQFAQLNLLDPARQLELVDSCGGADLKEAKELLARLFPEMLSAEKEILELKKRKSSLETDLESAPLRVRQIKALSLFPGCEKEWSDELSAFERRITEAGRYEEILSSMTGGENGPGLIDQLDSILRDLYLAAPGESKKRWEELGERALSSVQELFSSARSELGIAPAEELEAGRDALEAKIGMLRKIKRETGMRSEEELLGYIAQVEEDMKWLKESRSVLDDMQARAARMRSEAGSLARKLRALRERAASVFTERVNGHLADLAMGDSKFNAEIARLDKVRAS
ncbi:MAG: AAA family ATPase, partial [Synergistaceae bacterium]|nr:AAA family ATPase [Synergistaceae bacterium]